MIAISLSCGVESTEDAARVVEIFGRVMTGVAIDGIYVSMSVQRLVDEPSPVGSEDYEGPS